MRRPKARASDTPAKQLAAFIAKFDPAVGKLIRSARAALRKRLPAAIEQVYGVSLSFYYGATLPDPDEILLGSGNQNRFVRLTSAATLAEPAVEKLLQAAIAQAKTPLPKTGRGYTIIKSVSAKQRPRRKLAR
jgi:hypothetical protein